MIELLSLPKMHRFRVRNPEKCWEQTTDDPTDPFRNRRGVLRSKIKLMFMHMHVRRLVAMYIACITSLAASTPNSETPIFVGYAVSIRIKPRCAF